MSADPNAGDYITGLRDSIASGKSVYGPADSPAAQNKIAELNARLQFGRAQGTIAPAAEWTVERVATEALARDFPSGDPALRPVSDFLANAHKAQLGNLAQMPPRELAQMTDAVAQSLADRASPQSAPYVRRGPNDFATGHQIAAALLADAAKVVTDPATLQLLKTNRSMLEYYAGRGQAIAAYQAKRTQFGLK